MWGGGSDKVCKKERLISIRGEVSDARPLTASEASAAHRVHLAFL